jgi:hypothetical protein
MLIILGVFIHQIMTITILIMNNFSQKSESIYYVNLINSQFIHYVMIWPIIGRAYYIYKSVKFNYSFLTKKVYPNYLEYENNYDFHAEIYTEKRNIYVSKLIFFPLTGIFIVIFILSLIKGTRCYLFSMNMYFSILLEECLDYVGITVLYITTMIKCFMDNFQIFIFMTFIYLTFRYPIKKDYFLIKLELTLFFIIWVIFHGVYHGLLIFNIMKSDPWVQYTWNYLEGVVYIFVIYYLIKFRNSISPDSFHSMIYNYDIFMQHPVCFNYFKDYIKNSAEDEYNLLFFYIDYHFYKKQFENNFYEDNMEFARLIFRDYFVRSDKNSRNSFSTIGYLDKIPKVTKTFSKLSFYIDFPLEIYEKVEEFSQLKFQVDTKVLFNIFEEAFLFVNNKLYNRYLTLFRNEDKYKKLEKLICYFDFEFIE